MSRSRHDAQERSRALRAALGCAPIERTIDVARRVVAENASLRSKVADLEKALELAWRQQESSSGSAGTGEGNQPEAAMPDAVFWKPAQPDETERRSA